MAQKMIFDLPCIMDTYIYKYINKLQFQKHGIYTCNQSEESMQTCKEVRHINKTQWPKIRKSAKKNKNTGLASFNP